MRIEKLQGVQWLASLQFVVIWGLGYFLLLCVTGWQDDGLYSSHSHGIITHDIGYRLYGAASWCLQGVQEGIDHVP